MIIDYGDHKGILTPEGVSAVELYRQLRTYLEPLLVNLRERERKVIEMRFGLVTGQGESLEDIALEFKVTRERIRQIESKALRKMTGEYVPVFPFHQAILPLRGYLHLIHVLELRTEGK